MAKKWPRNGLSRESSIFFISRPFFCAIVAPVKLGANFPFGFPFFPFSSFQAGFHSVQAREDPNVTSKLRVKLLLNV